MILAALVFFAIISAFLFLTCLGFHAQIQELKGEAMAAEDRAYAWEVSSDFWRTSWRNVYSLHSTLVTTTYDKAITELVTQKETKH